MRSFTVGGQPASSSSWSTVANSRYAMTPDLKLSLVLGRLPITAAARALAFQDFRSAGSCLNAAAIFFIASLGPRPVTSTKLVGASASVVAACTFSCLPQENMLRARPCDGGNLPTLRGLSRCLHCKGWFDSWLVLFGNQGYGSPKFTNVGGPLFDISEVFESQSKKIFFVHNCLQRTVMGKSS